jgi:hypothetical protein
MKSWDCFDTLVARRFIHPQSIFEEVGIRLGIPNFAKLRINAEKNSDGSYLGIYKNLSGVDPNVEFQIELEHIYAIRENIDRVQDGDIIVSDMYFSEKQITQILISCGLKKDVKIYVTPDGKRKGYIWSKLPNIDLHIGDNYKSDIKSPNKFGIRAEHYTNHKLTDTEEFVFLKNKELACWMRYIRLQCPYNNHHERNLWYDQSNFNLPVLALASLELPKKTITFTFRDSIYWQQVYESITNRPSKQLHVSRACYLNPSKKFTNYVLSETKDCVIVDLQGTGKSVKSFFKQDIPEIIYICGPTESPVTSIAGRISDSIERHNCSSLGPLIDWADTGPVRGECEHDLNIVKVQEEAVKVAIDSVKFFKIEKNKSLLIDLIWKMKNNYTHKNINWD